MARNHRSMTTGDNRMEERSIFLRKKNVLMAMLILVSLILPIKPAAFAGEDTVLRSIKPVPEKGDYRLRARPEASFDLVGILNAIKGKKIVIDDRKLVCVSGLRDGGVKKWSLVGVKLNRAGQVVKIVTISDEPN
jgi:hypothetical protein